jgi:hypothetical protein
MTREWSKWALTLASVTVVLGSTQAALAGAHTWDVNEVFTNADGTIVFIELREANGTPGETGLGGRVISADGTGKSVTILSNVAAPTSNKFYLLATQSFADLPGAPTPDRIIPPTAVPFFNVAGDTVRYSTLDAFTFGAVPTDGINSRNRLTGIAANSPTNYAGQTGSVNAAGPIPGDFDHDGDVDLTDFEHHADCSAGPETAPAPAIGGVTTEQCTEAFDTNSDGDVDLQDFADFQRRIGA